MKASPLAISGGALVVAVVIAANAFDKPAPKAERATPSREPPPVAATQHFTDIEGSPIPDHESRSERRARVAALAERLAEQPETRPAPKGPSQDNDKINFHFDAKRYADEQRAQAGLDATTSCVSDMVDFYLRSGVYSSRSALTAEVAGRCKVPLITSGLMTREEASVAAEAMTKGVISSRERSQRLP